jgi:hypothetical protein
MGNVVRFKHSRPNNRRRFQFGRIRISRSWVAGAAGAIVVAGILALEIGFPIVGCGVKGNISPNTGERIYHVAGQEYYLRTRVNWLRGERWFCSEADAQRAGWRRALR